MMAMKVTDTMVRIYANLVKNGRRSIDSLPEAYREPVKKLLEDSGK